MTDLPWLKFWVAPYWHCAEARSLSLEAKCLWIEMLIVMHKCARRGYLQRNGSSVALDSLGRQAGLSTDQCSQAFAEIQASGLIVQASDQTFFAPFMVGQAAKEAKDAANGKKGGHPTLKGGVNRGVNPPDKAQEVRGEIEDILSPPREGELAEVETDQIIPPWWGPCKLALDGWSGAMRGRGLSATHNETRDFLASLRGVAAGPPVQGKPACDVLAEVISRLWQSGSAWKSAKYVQGSIRNEVDDWRRNGFPSTRNGGSTGGAAGRKGSAGERRAARRAGEFSEAIDLPLA